MAKPYVPLQVDHFAASPNAVWWSRHVLHQNWSTSSKGSVIVPQGAQGNIVAESLMDNLFAPLAISGGYDLFVVEPGTARRGSEGLGPYEMLRPRRALGENNIYHVFGGREPLIDLNLTEERWQNYHYSCCARNRGSRADHANYMRAHLQSLLYQLHHERICNRMVRSHAARTGVAYAYTIRVRPDLLFLSRIPPPHKLDLGSPQAPIVHAISDRFLPSWADKFGIGLADVMDKYLERFAALFTFPGIAAQRNWNAEWFLVNVLRGLANATLQPHAGFKAVVARSANWTGRARLHNHDHGADGIVSLSAVGWLNDSFGA